MTVIRTDRQQHPKTTNNRHATTPQRHNATTPQHNNYNHIHNHNYNHNTSPHFSTQHNHRKKSVHNLDHNCLFRLFQSSSFFQLCSLVTIGRRFVRLSQTVLPLLFSESQSCQKPLSNPDHNCLFHLFWSSSFFQSCFVVRIGWRLYGHIQTLVHSHLISIFNSRQP